MVDLVHANGMELHVWTVNNPTRMQQLIDLGVDGITTDYPELLRDLLPPPSMMAASGRESFAMSPGAALTATQQSATSALLHQPLAAAVPEPTSVMTLGLLVGFSLLVRGHAPIHPPKLPRRHEVSSLHGANAINYRGAADQRFGLHFQ